MIAPRQILAAIFATLAGVAGAAEPLHLIPWPKHIEVSRGQFLVAPQTRLFVPPTLARSEYLAVERLCRTFSASGFEPLADRLAPGADGRGHIVLAVRQDAPTDLRVADGYELTITADGVNLTGNSASGLFQGLQTLTQVVEQHGAALPQLIIRDEPDFRWRGYYLDVSRGRVHTIEYLERTVDYLAAHKVNMFQLYVEHPFEFRFNPAIAHNTDGLTAADILRLDQYCRDRRILFVPSLQSFGHMAGVLSLPEYRDLADKEVTKTWSEMSWNERMHGLTINPKDPKALALLEQMHAEFLPLFEAPFVNVCADETYDLGEGKNAELAKEIGKGRLYLDHIIWLNDLSKRHNKQMMFWGDIVKKHPELIPDIPQDAILLNWGYGRKTDFESCRLFQEAGLQFFVCPGTSAWKRILPEITNADENIRRYAAAGKKYGAVGLLNTDWGDHGGYNLPTLSLHGVALGAAVAWNVDTPEAEAFDRSFAARSFSRGGEEVLRHWRRTSSAATDMMTWEQYYLPFDQKPRWGLMEPKKGPGLRREALDLAEALAGAEARDPQMAAELLHAARTLALLGEKLSLKGRLEDVAGKPDDALAADLRTWADSAEAAARDYEPLWRATSRESDLGDVRKALADLVADARRRAGS